MNGEKKEEGHIGRLTISTNEHIDSITKDGEDGLADIILTPNNFDANTRNIVNKLNEIIDKINGQES